MTIAFSHDSAVGRWTFARGLLAKGLSAPQARPAGSHQVHVWVDTLATEPSVYIALSREESVILQLDRRTVGSFLQETYAVVPLGAEPQYCDIDAELTRLLGA